MARIVTSVLIMALVLSSGLIYMDSLANGGKIISDGVKYFINSVINPPSFNKFQSMSSITDMIMTAVAFLFRVVAIGSIFITALIISVLAVMLITQEIKKIRKRRI
jgi:chromate transport protein ChrA